MEMNTSVTMGSTRCFAISRIWPNWLRELKSRPVRPTRSNQPSLTEKMSFKSVAKKNVGSDMPSSAIVVTV